MVGVSFAWLEPSGCEDGPQEAPCPWAGPAPSGRCTDTPATSTPPKPLYGRVAVALSESDEALRAIDAAPARKRHPTVILAALHDVALAGRAPALARSRSPVSTPAR